MDMREALQAKDEELKRLTDVIHDMERKLARANRGRLEDVKVFEEKTTVVSVLLLTHF